MSIQRQGGTAVPEAPGNTALGEMTGLARPLTLPGDPAFLSYCLMPYPEPRGHCGLKI